MTQTALAPAVRSAPRNTLNTETAKVLRDVAVKPSHACVEPSCSGVPLVHASVGADDAGVFMSSTKT